MAEVAALLCDHVLPWLPVRQWVLSVPRRLRPYLHHKPNVASGVLRIFLRSIRPTLRSASAGASSEVRIGAVSFLHRFDSSLNAHFHYHPVVLDEHVTTDMLSWEGTGGFSAPPGRFGKEEGEAVVGPDTLDKADFERSALLEVRDGRRREPGAAPSAVRTTGLCVGMEREGTDGDSSADERQPGPEAEPSPRRRWRPERKYRSEFLAAHTDLPPVERHSKADTATGAIVSPQCRAGSPAAPFVQHPWHCALVVRLSGSTPPDRSIGSGRSLSHPVGYPHPPEPEPLQ